ncbi:MAG TPA: oligosaccharide flippase family protein [Thermoanaerobaculia bacterium]|nr:oligosaccharide flippase family protein [Thermoanaerobaculia bacterium]
MGTARGLLRSGSAATAAQLVRIVALQLTHIVVRRHVPPDEMGIWNWIEPLFLLLATLRDLGLPAHVLRSRPVALGTLLRVELVWGALLGLGIVVAAPLVALGFREPTPELVDALRAMSIYLVVEGVAAVVLVGFEGKLRIERTLAAELLRTSVYCVVVLAAGIRGLGFWSFVAAQIAAQLVFAAELWRRARRDRLELEHEPGSIPRVVRASLPVGAIGMLGIAVTYADSFVVGRLFPRAELGLYAFAYAYAFLVTRVLQQPLGRALYPAFVAFSSAGAEQFRAYRLGTVLFAALEVPAAFLLAANAELATWLLAGREYLGAAPYLALLAFAPIVDPLGRFGGELLIARHRDRARLVSLALQLAALVGGGVALSIALGSPFGMAWANFVPIGSLVVLVVLARSGEGRELARLGRQLAEVYLVPVAPFALAILLAGDRTVPRLVATALAALACLSWTWWRHRGEIGSFFGADEPN